MTFVGITFLMNYEDFNLYLNPAPPSRLHALCMRCSYRDARTEFMTPRRDEANAFDDRCPACHTDEVEIYDPRYTNNIR